MSSVYPRGDRLYCRLKDESGKWVSKPTRYVKGQERDARQYAKGRQDRIDKRREAGLAEAGVPTVKAYAEKWIVARKGRVATWKDEHARLRLHVYPTLGTKKLDEVRPRQVRDWVLKLREQKDDDGEPALAPRTIRHVFQTLRRVFKSAKLEEHVTDNPIEVDNGILPPNVDADPAWRPGAIYTRAEVVQLISDLDDVPEDRRVLHALQALAGLRAGEASWLRWRDYERDLEPLGRLHVLKTKTKVPRQVPVHPTLAAILAEWKLSGWQRTYKRRPEADDFITPDVVARLVPNGTTTFEQRPKWLVTRGIGEDLEALGLRHRRGHDLRRTFITLCREDGARADLLEVVTHGAKSGDMISLYTTFSWATLCAEVAKLQITRAAPSEVATLNSGLATPLLQSVPAR
jgi:integrase